MTTALIILLKSWLCSLLREWFDGLSHVPTEAERDSF